MKMNVVVEGSVRIAPMCGRLSLRLPGDCN
jgi:hypothetical protein